ncbi:1413_t:CDS:2, partial [Diversispora eburnea]
KLSKLDYDEFIQTCIWRPKKEGKQGNISVEQFVLRMGARYGHEVLENQQLIKKGLFVNEYLYKVPKPDVVKRFNKKINIDYYTKSLFTLCTRFINYDDKYQPLPESLAKALNRKKKSKKKESKNIKDSLQSSDSLSLDEDEIANIKDVESQKLAKKWLKNYIKNLCDALKKDETIISHLWKDATTHAEKICSGISEADMTRPSGISMRYNDYLNVLDRIASSTYSKLSDLLSKLSKLNVNHRNATYELIVQAQKYKPDIAILEEYIFQFNLESECE